ncbi:MAG: hypothetical protein U5K54_14030 [Cytophagales bacterium]|nr:hypothetical protein [Cytophagales bacterium]
MSDRVQILSTEILSDNWYTLRKITYNYKRNNGSWIEQNREAYDRGNGATILLFNKEKENRNPDKAIPASYFTSMATQTAC